MADAMGSHIGMWFMILVVIVLIMLLIYFAGTQGLGRAELPNFWG
jgi:uncharacterized membrane protein